MKCPFCGDEDTRVIDSRPADDNTAIRRRRQCDVCGKRFTTFEKVEATPLMVIKKDKSREPYNREKIVKGLIRSCHKRPVPMERIEDLDGVAYVRFASVYREFKDVNTFMDELKKILK